MINFLQMERLHSIVATRGFNCGTSQWWTKDAESSKGIALEEIIDVNNF